MKILKMLSVVFLGVVVLGGCDDKEQESYENVRNLMSKQERTLIDQFISKYSYENYNRLYRAVNLDRVSNAETLDSNGFKKEAYRSFGDIDVTKPFCSYTKLITDIESDWNKTEKTYSISGQWEDAKGETLSESCGVPIDKTAALEEAVEQFVTPTPTQINEQVVEATVTLKEEALLSPAKVVELTKSAKNCNRAKIELLSLTKGGRYLTIDDYEAVTKLTLDCVNLQLQIELNE